MGDQTKLISAEFMLIDKRNGRQIHIFNEFIVGKAGNEQFPDDEGLADQQFVILIEGSQPYLFSMGEQNPTKINGKIADHNVKIPLNVNDVIEASQQKFVLSDGKTQSASLAVESSGGAPKVKSPLLQKKATTPQVKKGGGLGIGRPGIKPKTGSPRGLNLLFLLGAPIFFVMAQPPGQGYIYLGTGLLFFILFNRTNSNASRSALIKILALPLCLVMFVYSGVAVSSFLDCNNGSTAACQRSKCFTGDTGVCQVITDRIVYNLSNFNSTSGGRKFKNFQNNPGLNTFLALFKMQNLSSVVKSVKLPDVEKLKSGDLSAVTDALKDIADGVSGGSDQKSSPATSAKPPKIPISTYTLARLDVPALTKDCEDNDNGESCYKLSVAYAKAGNKDKAKEFLDDGCDNDYGEACFQMGKISVKKGDIGDAEDFFEKACEKGKHQNGCFMRASLHVKERDFDDALELLNPLCTNRMAAACYKAGVVYLLDKNRKTARTKFQSACSMGYQKACNKLTVLKKR